MNKTIFSIGLTLLLALGAQATVVNWYSGTLTSVIADNSVAGSTFNTSGGSWSGTPSGILNNVSVVLNISGGYNGDLYGYLVYNDGSTTQTAILLNRVGGGSGTAAASTAGFGGGSTSDFATLQSAGVTLSDSGTSGSIQSVAAAAGNSYTTGGGNLNSTFVNMSSGGTWTLFLADMSAGDQSTLVSWGLNVSVVPEPTTWALLIFCGGFLVMGVARRLRRDVVGTIAH